MNIKNIKLMKQPMMRKVIYSLFPIIIASIYFYGWRALILCLVSSIGAFISEWIFKRKTGKPVSEAVFVTGLLFALTLPPSTPYWVAIVGIAFGIVFGKEVFGGFGRNVFNPALVGRAFVYVSFPKYLTITWTTNAANTSILGGFTQYMPSSIDALSTATPMLMFRSTSQLTDYKSLLLGNVSGSMGESSAILIILAAIYLIYTKTAAKETIFGVLGGFVGLSLIMNFLGVAQVPNPLFGLLSGGILFGAVFMATDPISSPKTVPAKWIYGALIGMVTVVIRGFALFAGGIMFAILIGNTFAPILDELVKYVKKPKEKRGAVNG